MSHLFVFCVGGCVIRFESDSPIHHIRKKGKQGYLYLHFFFSINFSFSLFLLYLQTMPNHLSASPPNNSTSLATPSTSSSPSSSSISNTHTSDIPLLTAPFLHYIPTSPPSQELDFHLPSRTPLHGLTVSEWAGTKSNRCPCK